MLILPEFKVLQRQPQAPHVARTVIQREVPNEYGTPITYTVEQGRNKKDWWIHASREGFRMSNTLHTKVPAKAQSWIHAVETGQICVGCSTPRPPQRSSPKQLDREIKEALAQPSQNHENADGYRVAFLVPNPRRGEPGQETMLRLWYGDTEPQPMPQAMANFEQAKRQGYTAWVTDSAGLHVPVRGAMRPYPGHYSTGR